MRSWQIEEERGVQRNSPPHCVSRLIDRTSRLQNKVALQTLSDKNPFARLRWSSGLKSSHRLVCSEHYTVSLCITVKAEVESERPRTIASRIHSTAFLPNSTRDNENQFILSAKPTWISYPTPHMKQCEQPSHPTRADLHQSCPRWASSAPGPSSLTPR